MRRFAALLVVILACLVPQTAQAQPKKPKWLPKVWYAIGMCETGLNWRHNTTSYEGAFGFHYRSWDGFKPHGYPRDAWMASPRQQYVVARRIYARYHFSGWGCYTHGGYLAYM